MTALALKSTIAVAVALVVVFAARKSRASMRHMVLAASFAFLLLLPLADRFAPAVAIPQEKVPRVVWASGLPLEGAVEVQGRPEAHTTPSINWLLPTYIGGVALLLAWLLLGIWRLRRLARTGEVWLEGTARMNEIAHEANIRRPALVVVSGATNVPLTFGFRTSTIVLPLAAKSWDADALGRALRHELEHVRREDWALQLLARAACALYWPNPLVWAAWRRFCFEAERACDDAVVATFDGAEAYAGQLVSLARDVRGMSTVPALGMASPSRLAQRVRALLDRTQRRGPHGRLATTFVIAVTLLFLAVVAPARLVAAAKAVADDNDPPKRLQQIQSVLLAESLIEAAADGYVSDVSQILRSGVDVNTILYGDGTALIAASRHGQLEMVRFLIEEGADVNLAAYGDGNPLIAAAAKGHADVVELLLDRGARIDEMVHGDENPLIKAAWHGHGDVVKLLVRRGADVNARYDEDGRIRTPLRMARAHGHAGVVQFLIDSGAKD